LAKNGFGLTKTEVQDLVAEYLKKTGIQSRFKNNRPGNDWWLAFKSRYKLSIKKPEGLEHSRKSQLSDPFVIYEFYDRLEKAIEDANLNNKPHQIFNCDETSFCHDPKKTKVVAVRGQSCYRHTAANARENTTVLACVNAAGEKMPPLVIFKGKNLWNKWIPANETFPGTSYTATPNGWMTSEVFENWFKNQFLPFVGEVRPIILIFDDHTTHVTPQLLQLAEESGVIIQKLPAHTSSKLQPLDVACFSSLKTKSDNLLVTWQRSNAGMRPSKENFSKLLGRAWESLKESNIKNGFRATGIFDPDCNNQQRVNKNNYSTSLFNPEKLKRYLELKTLKVNTDRQDDISTSHTEAQSEISLSHTGQGVQENAGKTCTCSLNTFEEILLENMKTQKVPPTVKTGKKKIAGTGQLLKMQ
jgi:hypothetical protein